MKNAAGLVLCGGRSSRMGRPKSWLELAGESLLARAVRTMDSCTDRVIVCASRGQTLPPVSLSAIRLEDAETDCGPLRALAGGLRLAESLGFDRVLVLAVDLPLFTPTMGQFLLGLFRESDMAVVPWSEGFPQPLAAAYRTELAPVLETVLASGIQSMRAFVSRIPHREILPCDYAHLDSAGRMFRNLNTPQDYQQLVDEATSSEPPGFAGST